MHNNYEIPQDDILFESAFKYSPLGIALVSPEGKWLKVNQALLKLLGYSEAELLKTDFIQITHPDDLAQDLGYVKELLHTKRESYQFEKRYFHKSGDIVYALLSVSLIRHSDGTPKFFISQILDMTQAKMSQIKLQHNAKLLAVGEMSVGIAHEINNPLTVISLHAWTLKDLMNDHQIDRLRVISSVEKINSTVMRISGIVASLRKLSNNSKMDSCGSVEIRDIIEDALGLCKEKFKRKGVSLSVNIPEDVALECNSLDISQVLINLMNNAFYAVKNQLIKEISISVERDFDYLYLSVTDSGPGIPFELRGKIMDPFFTTKPMGEGTGLGLSISNNIAQVHNGELYLDEESHQTKFVLKLPIKQDHLSMFSVASSTAERMLPM